MRRALSFSIDLTFSTGECLMVALTPASSKKASCPRSGHGTTSRKLTGFTNSSTPWLRACPFPCWTDSVLSRGLPDLNSVSHISPKPPFILAGPSRTVPETGRENRLSFL